MNLIENHKPNLGGGDMGYFKKALPVIILIVTGLVFNGCYTQFSRPGVDTPRRATIMLTSRNSLFTRIMRLKSIMMIIRIQSM